MSYEQQCVAAVQDSAGRVRRCSRPAQCADGLYLAVIPVCSWHETKAATQFARPLMEEIAELKQAADDHDCDGDRAVADFMASEVDRQLERSARLREKSTVYFIACGPYIKIGVSKTPEARLETIRAIGGVRSPNGLNLGQSKLLATEPGGHSRERQLHAEFDHLRDTGEWFRSDPELLDYINSLVT